MSSGLGDAGRLAPKIFTACAADAVFSAEMLVPKITGSLPMRTSFTSTPVSSYAPVNQRPDMFLQSRSTNITWRQSPSRPRH